MVFVGTFGAAVFIGSKRESQLKFMVCICHYLDRGTGNAWAGHNNVTLVLTTVLNPLTESIVGNFGDTRPTGSKHT